LHRTGDPGTKRRAGRSSRSTVRSLVRRAPELAPSVQEWSGQKSR
jgi:hypothetical protein